MNLIPRKKNTSQLIVTLVLGFSFLIVLLAMFAYISNKEIVSSFEIIQGSGRASNKMEIIVKLIETARSRTRLTLSMIYETDPFVKDETNMELDIQASRFYRLREELRSLGLDKEEKNILAQQAAVISSTLALQRKAAELALSTNPEIVKNAQKILLNDVYAGQGIIIDHFLKLLALQKKNIDDSQNAAKINTQRATQTQLYLFFIILILAFSVAFYVIRRTVENQKELYFEKEKALITLKSIGDAVITTDQEGIVEYLNPVAEKITGLITHNVSGSPITQIFKAYDEANQRWLADCIVRFLSKGSYNMPSNDIVLFNNDEEKLDIALTIAPIQGSDDEILGTITTFQDITKEKTMAKHIEHQARHDVLTGLLNRREFENKVEQALTLYSDGKAHALCIMDLDRFKIINDTLGHAAGDELLKQITQRIKTVLRQTDLFARIGGDEFALFLSYVNPEDAEKIAQKILSIIREHQFIWGNKSFKVGASIGLVDAPPQVSNYENLYHAADTACYMAKHGGRDRVHSITFNDENVTEKREQTQWVSRINDALENNNFILYAQDINPIGNSPDLIPHKEVLIRMLDDNNEIIPPMAFIPPAERYDLMPLIDEWVIHNVIKKVTEDNSNTVYAINLSGQSMGDSLFTQKITDAIQKSNINHSRLCFEITETAAIASLENATEFLANLQSLGCHTALDDFGSGLSSFAYLKNLPINYLKIDGVFIKQIVEDPTSRVMVEAIHSIGRTMDLKTIAEFVETEDIKNLLQEMGIDYAQGYFYGAPTPLYTEEK
jgi:diguanylate cyclase (GGDEF)-like protein/PAS domain S-box-containing protein